MESLDKRIAGDWFDIRRIIDDRHAFEDFLDLTEVEVRALAEGLRLSVECGTVEYKRKILQSVITFADSHQFDARSFQDTGRQGRELLKLIYLSLLQRNYSTGSLSPRRRKAVEPEDTSGAVRKTELKEIVEDLRARIGRDQSLRRDPTVKTILALVARYRKEVDNMRELAPNIPREKYAAFADNFRKTFEELTQRVQERYAGFLQGLEPAKPTVQPRDMFARYDLKPLGGLFALQTQEFARIRSILAHAERERYQIRGILLQILARRGESLSLVERELKEYERIAFSRGERLAREFAAEVSAYLLRKLSVPTAR